MFCPKCGTQNPDDAVFCQSCGASCQQQSAAAAPPAPAPGTAVPAGATPTPMASGAASALKKNKVPMIVGIVVAVVAVVAIIAGIVSCVSGGGIAPGTYTVKPSSYSDTYSATVNDDKTISLTLNGNIYVLDYAVSGSQGDSDIYDLSLKKINNIEVTYDDAGYITNYGAATGDNSTNLVKITAQLLIPKSGTMGEPKGMWGFSFAMESNNRIDYRAILFDVQENGTLTSYSVSDSGVMSVPGLTVEELVAAKAYTETNWWRQSGNNAFVISETPNGGDSYDMTITRPSK